MQQTQLIRLRLDSDNDDDDGELNKQTWIKYKKYYHPKLRKIEYISLLGVNFLIDPTLFAFHNLFVRDIENCSLKILIYMDLLS